MSVAEQYAPGELVRARGREWVVVEAHSALTLRPLAGSEAETETFLPEIEVEPVDHATFDHPDASRPGGREAAQLLRDALRLSLRRGAGPFRSTGRLNFVPRAYQLAPLMMALRQDTIRLLNADDVGVGKTIETGLILREMLDRGEIDRFTVLCPPHLVEQWTRELEMKFSIPATPVTASAAARLERDLPTSMSVFDAYPYTVVSLDFIKSERRFFDFKSACPKMVVVDEAHTAVGTGQRRQRRYELVRSLADEPERHLILLTATPHSGDETAFHNLLGLIDKSFANLPETTGDTHRNLREKLAAHFIQRRRGDIEDWREPGLFPTHETSELKYRLTGEYELFYNRVLDYCAEAILSVDGDVRQRTTLDTLALMRCVGSSPAASARALKNRAVLDFDEAAEAHLTAQTLDDEEHAENDLEPGVSVDDPRLTKLIDQAEALSAHMSEDPKFRSLLKILKGLTHDGFSPIIFCRFIATAEQVAATLAKKFKHYTVEAITGTLSSEEREVRVEQLGEHEHRILVATDCLAEGINLQDWFDAVVHYDLSWNPTRHQQREGRIDRFGQKNPMVRSVLIYGINNPVDGAVLSVILRKAQAIEKQTGVRVPLPDDNGSLMKALMSSVLLRAKDKQQGSFDFNDSEEANRIELAWQNASEKEKRSRTIFAQHSLKPEEVIKEWDATQAALGGYADTERFVIHAMKRLNAALEPIKSKAYRAPVHLTPEAFRERFITESLIEDASDKPIRIGFSARPPTGCLSVHRAHALPSVLAETFLEQALDNVDPQQNNLAVLPRTGAWECTSVDTVTWLVLLRIRHKLDARGKLGPKFSMAEEAGAIAFSALDRTRRMAGDDAFDLLDREGDSLAETIGRSEIEQGLATLPSLEAQLNEYAAERAAMLADDHTRVRQALGSQAQVHVDAITPVDVVGFYVLMPSI